MFLPILLAVVGALTQAAFIIVEHKEKYVLAVILKGLASVFFVVLGVYSLVTNSIVSSNVPTLVVIGLALGLIGDVCLNLRFVFTKIGSKIFLAGVAAFLAGHILYLCGICQGAQADVWWAVLIGAIIAAVILLIIFKVLDVKLSYKIFGIVYIGAVIIMTAIAVYNVILDPSTFHILYAIGANAFSISDVVLIFNSFGPNPKFALRITNLSFYYIGQILIALSIMFLA